MDKKENGSLLTKQMAIPQKVVDIIALILMCVVSTQPLVGICIKIEDPWALINMFFLKSNIVRTTGILALLLGITFYILKRELTLGKMLQESLLKRIWNLFLLLSLVGILISYLYSFNPYLSLYGDSVRFEGVLGFLGYAGLFGIASLVESEKIKKVWIYFTIGISTVLGIVTLISYFGKIPYLIAHMNNENVLMEGELCSTFIQYNHYGYYLTVIIMLIAGLFLCTQERKLKIMYGLLLGFHEYVLALNTTRGCYVAVIVGLTVLCILLLKQKRITFKNVLILLAIGIVAIVCTGRVFLEEFISIFYDGYRITNEQNADSAGSGRWRLWKLSLQLIKEKPIVGYGPNMSYYFLGRAGVYDMPHNEYLQYAVDFGLPTVLLYLVGLCSIFVDRIKKIKGLPAISIILGCAAVGYGVSAFFGVSVPIATSFFFILLGLQKDSVITE